MEIIKYNELAIEKVCEAIKMGVVAICPTDTVYGLIVDAVNKEAVDKIFETKKRDKAKAISVFVRGIEEIKKFAFVNENQRKFLEENLPGKFTVILKKKPNCGLAENLFGGKETIGIRIINNKIISDILGKINKPLTATSANISGQPASGKIKEILEQFENQEIKPDLVLDAGDLPESSPSKIIDLTIRLSEDADYYVVHMACFPLSRLVHYRLSYMPEDKNTLFFNNDKKTALEMAEKVEKTALKLLDRIIATTPNVQKSLAKSIMSVLGSIRTLNEKDALEFIEKLAKFPDEETSEITSIFLYYAEFRKDSFKDWQCSLPGLYDDLHPFNEDRLKTKFKEIMLKNSETRAAFAWEFYRITDSALRKVKHSLDYEEAFSLSIKYMQQLISEYDHRTFETVYRFIEENIEQSDKFDLCYELWLACLKKEKLALESLVKTKNIYDVYWWPYHYNGKLLLLVKQRKSDDIFLDILRLLAEYPKEVSIGDVSDAIALLKGFPKTDNRVEQIFRALVLRNSNYFHDKQEWLKQP